MRQTILAALLGVASTLATTAASASPLTFDFGRTATDGPLAGASSSGFFTYDDSIVPVGGGLVNATGLLTDLSITWNGIPYTEATANTGSLLFNAAGVLTSPFFGTDCSAGGCSSGGALGESWYWFPGFLSYATAGEGGGIGTSSFQLQEVAVPEPGSLALLSLGLVALGVGAWTRRRKVNLFA